MGEIETGGVRAGGLEFGYLSAGPTGGPLALCLHGFPDSAHTWRHLLPELAAAGYRAVAPFMRGYAPTSVPDDGAYQIGALVADAVALHETFGGDSDAVIVGHDWGALAAYAAVAHAPRRWRRAVTLAVPPVNALMEPLLEYHQLKRSFYIFLFQTPLAEAALDRSFVQGLWRDWSPGYQADTDIAHAMDCLATPANITAAVSYYRAMFGRPTTAYAAEQAATARGGERPVLYLHGTADGCLGDNAAAPEAVLGWLPVGSRAESVAGAGHFLHLERPGEVNRRILQWLTTGY